MEIGTEEAEVAEGGWGEQNEDDNVSYARMLKFILPTLGIWLASPIMSLVDAGVVGEFFYCRNDDRQASPTKAALRALSQVPVRVFHAVVRAALVIFAWLQQ